jgi:hypothetical protein
MRRGRPGGMGAGAPRSRRRSTAGAPRAAARVGRVGRARSPARGRRAPHDGFAGSLRAAGALLRGAAAARRLLGGRPRRRRDLLAHGRRRPRAARRALDAFWAGVPEALPCLEHLCNVLKDKLAAPESNPVLRAASHDARPGERRRQKAPRLSAGSRQPASTPPASPATASLRVTRAEAAQRLADFSAGRAGLLICIAVAEEGMDVPAAICVVRFDPTVHSLKGPCTRSSSRTRPCCARRPAWRGPSAKAARQLAVADLLASLASPRAGWH